MIPYVRIIISMLGEKVHRRNPEAANIAPAIVTALQPNLLARTLARGPKMKKRND